MTDTERVEELTLALLDSHVSETHDEVDDEALADARAFELAGLIAADGRAMEVHVSLVELEAALRGEAEAPDLAEAVVARIRRELGRRAERGVMARIGGIAPEGRNGGASVSISMNTRNAEIGTGRNGRRGLWLASAVAGIAVAAAVGFIAVSALRVEPGKAPAVSVDAAKPDANDLVAIPLMLPKPAFTGTPKQVSEGVNLKKSEEGDDKDRPPFMAPPGVKNVARGKPVTCSDEEPIIGDPEQITDGDKEAGDGSYVVFGPGTQHVTIDLEDVYEIYAIVVWHYHGDPRIYHDVIVQIAGDADFISGVKTIFNNDHDNSSGLGLGENHEYFENHEGLLVDANGVKTRYLRLYSNGSTVDEMNRYAEIEVHGRLVNE